MAAVQMSHALPDSWFQRAIDVHVIGCGGTGSALVPGLVKIHRTLLALNHPEGLSVTVWDGDTVSESNTVRQNFFEADVGANKADVMVTRLNVAHAAIGLNWSAMNRSFTSKEASRRFYTPNLIIGCVDTKASRREILKYLQEEADNSCYWLDCGNKADLGQVVCGEWRHAGNKSKQLRLPLVTELLPEIITGAEDDELPSCSAVQSILRQGVLTNQMCATWALSWLSEGLRHGKIDWNGVFFNLAMGRVTSIPVNPEKWASMGYTEQKATMDVETVESPIT